VVAQGGTGNQNHMVGFFFVDLDCMVSSSGAGPRVVGLVFGALENRDRHVAWNCRFAFAESVGTLQLLLWMRRAGLRFFPVLAENTRLTLQFPGGNVFAVFETQNLDFGREW